jgi:hypothetical protein
MNKKYYVICSTPNGVQFKKYKCIDGWANKRNDCWEFTKQGAEAIAKRLNERNNNSKVHYNILEAGTEASYTDFE